MFRTSDSEVVRCRQSISLSYIYSLNSDYLNLSNTYTSFTYTIFYEAVFNRILESSLTAGKTTVVQLAFAQSITASSVLKKHM